MSDLIDRQAAMDALRAYLVGKRCPDDGTLTCRLIENEVINKLPTIQPELGANLAEVGTDCISREQAIDAVNSLTYPSSLMDVKRKLMLLPPAEPKRGKWIHHPEMGWGETWLCDQCGEKTTSTVMGKPRANFCPNCGAKMEETT